MQGIHDYAQCTEVHFASFLSGGFVTAIVVNPLKRKLAKRTSVQWCKKLPKMSGNSQKFVKKYPNLLKIDLYGAFLAQGTCNKA